MLQDQSTRIVWLCLLMSCYVTRSIKQNCLVVFVNELLCYKINQPELFGCQTAAKILEAADMSVDPCEDFFQYACGSWNKRHIIPEDKTSYNTFEKLHDELQVVLKSKKYRHSHMYSYMYGYMYSYIYSYIYSYMCSY